MKIKRSSSEDGQVLVLIVLAIVALLGFTALAVDGSMIYSDRRFAQNAADTASLAGGGAAALAMENLHVYYNNWNACGNANLVTAAADARTAVSARAQSNGFVLNGMDSDLSDGIGVTVQCGEDTSGYFPDRYIDVRVMLTRETNTAFAHFVYSGPLRTTVEAVTRVRPRTPLVFGNAIVALNPNACSGNSNGLQFRGNLTLNVVGGGVFSNGCMDVDGGNHPRIQNGGAAYFYGGNSLGNITFYDSGGNQIAGSPVQLSGAANQIPPSAYDVPVPDCTGHTISGSSLTGQSNLSGLYCVTGDMSIHNSGGSIAGTDVTLVFMGGKVTVNGGTMRIQAPPAGYQGDAIPGIAIYMPKQYYGPTCGEVNQELKINGNVMNDLVGTILAPCTDISLEGGGDTMAYQSQVIGWNVNSGGNATLNVVFDDSKQYSKPTFLELFK
ncbi:MAG: Tad domain-containing protein [Chloroflexota bacterium]